MPMPNQSDIENKNDKNADKRISKSALLNMFGSPNAVRQDDQPVPVALILHCDYSAKSAVSFLSRCEYRLVSPAPLNGLK